MTIRKGLALLLVCLIIAGPQGCAATRYGKQETSVHYFPECYAPMQKLRQSKSHVVKSTAGGALIGAVGGALLGLLTGKAENAVTGAVIGGAGGAVAGYATGKNAQEQEENRLMYQFIQEIDGDISNLNLVSAAASSSLQCYDRRFRSTVNDYKNGRITRAELNNRYSEIQSGTREASNLLGDAANSGRDLERRYQQALNEGVSPQEQANGGRSRSYAYYGDGYPYSDSPKPSDQRYSKPSTQKRYRPSAAKPSPQRTYKSENAQKIRKKTVDLSRRVDDLSAAKRAAEDQTRQQEAEMQAIIASAKA